MRATAQDQDAAAMMGIDVNRTISFTFLLAGCLAGVGRRDLRPLLHERSRSDTGFPLGLIAFTAAVLGGIGNLPGRRARGDADRPHRGVQRAGCAGTRPAGTGPSPIIFAILILILVFRPEGLLGERTPEGG